MKTVNIHEAKTYLSAILVEVQNGEEVVISKNNLPIARLIPEKIKRKRVAGTAKNKIKLKKGFEKPLPLSMIREFES
ncbi:MAG: type II toxin-antitoxin system prevent-host-death family antitoxin [Deltaproteobacteria bacterium]|nr:type II toxin-antitoxin system prevent-host-death family antitoxin [Deltaproteobacteria bacterium]